MNIKEFISFAEHMRIEQLRRLKTRQRKKNKDISKPARLILVEGYNQQNIISACLEAGYYQQYNKKGKRK